MAYTMYTPLNVWLDPASVTDVVAYIQTYLSENTIYSETEIETIIHDYLIAHPELIGGVQSVNGKTGTVVLSASDINTEDDVTIESVLASLSSQISSIAASVATNTNNITSLTGRVSTAETDLANLKSSLTHLYDPALAGYHNSIYRGKNITSYLTDGSLWKRLTGTGGYALFEDLYIGDYITVGSNSYEIADFDYYIRCSSNDIQKHHIVMIPKSAMVIPAGTVLYGSTDTLELINTENAGVTVSSQETQQYFKWNATIAAPNDHTTNGGYKYSRMRTVIMKAADTIVVNAFGAAHIQKVIPIYPNPASESDSAFAGWTWFNVDDWSDPNRMSICDLMNETQVYGHQIWGQWNTFNSVGYEDGIDKFQFALFAKNRSSANIRAYWWLRSVHSATSAAVVDANGYAGNYGSATALAVRPRFLLVG